MCIVNFTPFPALTTERLQLRQLTVADENEFFILKSDKEILQFLDVKPKTFDEARAFLQRINDGIAENEWILWGITLKGENTIIGTVCLWNLSIKDCKAEIGYELMPAYQGKGFMQEAVEVVIEYGFKNMNLRYIEALPNPNNLKSVKLLEKSGFVKQVHLKNNNLEKESTIDTVIYTLTNIGV